MWAVQKKNDGSQIIECGRYKLHAAGRHYQLSWAAGCSLRKPRTVTPPLFGGIECCLADRHVAHIG